MDWTLELHFRGPFGQQYVMSIAIGESIASEVEKVERPVPWTSTIEDTVAVLKRKEFRKELFIHEATRLGHLLAERMEDAEGWYDASRIEPAKEQLRAGLPRLEAG